MLEMRAINGSNARQNHVIHNLTEQPAVSGKLPEWEQSYPKIVAIMKVVLQFHVINRAQLNINCLEIPDYSHCGVGVHRGICK